MKRFTALSLLALCASCASMSQTVTDTSADSTGKPVVNTTVSNLSCQGFGCNAQALTGLDIQMQQVKDNKTISLAGLDIRRQQVADDGKVDLIAVQKGQPVQRNGTAGQSGTQTGYQFGMNGMYDPYGYGGNPYGMNPYGVSPEVMRAEAASFGYMQGNLPQLVGSPVYVPPQQPQVLQMTSGNGTVTCPEVPRTIEEQLACIHKDQVRQANLIIRLQKKK